MMRLGSVFHDARRGSDRALAVRRRIARTLGWLVLALPLVAAAMPRAPYRPDAFDERLDALVSDGYDHPARALQDLQSLQSSRSLSVDEQRAVLNAVGTIQAQNGRSAEAAATADRLLAIQSDDPNGRLVAASNLLRALIAENAGQLDVAAALAQSALGSLKEGCPGATSAEDRGSLPCAYRPSWTALEILERRASSQGLTVTATTRAQSALVIAEWAGDARRAAINLSALALYADGRGEHELAQRLVARARHLAAQTDSPVDRARVLSTEARLAIAHGDRRIAVQSLNEALAIATAAQASRVAAAQLTALSDVYGRLKQPAEALRAADRGLVIARSHGDVGLERVLINNAGIAKIGLGRIAEGKRDLARLLEMRIQSGETGKQVITLLEFGQALAEAGDARGALELYHRERALSTEVMQANRAIALKELQTRFDAQARDRDIELLSRDSALKSAALANRGLLQRIWWMLAFVMSMAVTLVAILYRRVRDTHRKLEASHVQLQAQSDRDPLTNLANRRHFQAVMTDLCRAGGFEGALLLVDLDHFKHVNDRHGHAAGDHVLVEAARRLNEAVRSDDLVVRWGGEEFLILAPRANAEQAEQLATRVLRVLGQTPVPVGTEAEAPSLHVTASIGYARFPLPPYLGEVPWEQAVNLADMALYTAKNQGRNRAVGITSSTAATAEALREIESDFDRAWHAGKVTLAQTLGPETRESTVHELTGT